MPITPICEWTYQYSSGLGILRGIAFSSSNRRWSNILSRVLFRDKNNESYTKVKGAIDPSAPTIYPELIPVFIAWSDGWDSSLSRATATRLFARTHLLSWLERERHCEAKVPCPWTQLDDSARSRTQTSRPGVQCAGRGSPRIPCNEQKKS